jgi:glycosyltransferase involved in cell wall biosynthesis
MPRVSIVVPNYNHARFLRQRVDSILNQTFQDFELILLDDYSTDDSRSILSSYASDPRVRLDFNEKNSGSTYKQWNKGVRLARAEYVWIAESDDYAGPRLLEKLLALLDANSAVQLAFCRSRAVTEDGETDGFAELRFWASDQDCWSADYCREGSEVCRNYMIRTNIVLNASSAVFRKPAYESAGGADETMRLMSDWKLWAAIMLQGKVAYLSEPLNFYRFHGHTMRQKVDFLETIIPEYFAVAQWIQVRVTPPPEVMRRAYRDRAEQWVPILMSSHTPPDLKKSILASVRQFDPHPVRSALRPGLRTIGRKFLRHWNELLGASPH